MRIEAAEATALIADIEAIRRAVRRSTSYRLASAVMILWGVVTAAGNLASHVFPVSAGKIWIGADLLGFLATCALAVKMRRDGYRSDWRAPTALLLIFGFGLLWSVAIGRFGPRELAAFWPTLFMLAYSVIGLWLGAGFVALGLGITALVTLGYFLAGPWFGLYLALVNGGGLIACGLWMRRA